MNVGGMGLRRPAAHPARPGRVTSAAGAGVSGVWGPVAALAEGSRRTRRAHRTPVRASGGASVRVTVTVDDSGPLMIALECAPLGAVDAGELADHLIRAARAWWHGPVQVVPEPPEPPELPERPEPPEQPEPTTDEELRRAGYVLLDRSRSVAQVAAVLGVPREQVREWDRAGRW